MVWWKTSHWSCLHRKAMGVHVHYSTELLHPHYSILCYHWMRCVGFSLSIVSNMGSKPTRERVLRWAWPFLVPSDGAACAAAAPLRIRRGRRIENGKQIIWIQWLGRVIRVGRWHDERHVVCVCKREKCVCSTTCCVIRSNLVRVVGAHPNCDFSDAI